MAGFNLSLIMRKLFGRGTARGLQGLFARILGGLGRIHGRLKTVVRRLRLLLAGMNTAGFQEPRAA